MPAKTISALQLEISCSAKFFILPRPLSAAFVRRSLKDIITAAGAQKIGKPQIREAFGSSQDQTFYSFQCVRLTPSVSFLKGTKLREVRYGFVLIIERKGYLAVFSKALGGVDAALESHTKEIPRHKMTHVWGDVAVYQKLSARRMAMGNTELRGIQFEAPDLQTAMPPSAAGRSIPQTFRLHVVGDPVRSITPGTGRVLQGGEKCGMPELLTFIDAVIEQIERSPSSSFLRAFSTPINLDDLPASVKATGLLLDLSRLNDLRESDDVSATLKHPNQTEEQLYSTLAPVFDITPLRKERDRWNVTHNGMNRAVLKRLAASYGLTVAAAKGWTIEYADGSTTSLERWFQTHDAFSIAFSDPEYFYALGSLFRRSGFRQEAQLVHSLLRAVPDLLAATSEKGPVSTYDLRTKHFTADSIFGVLEKTMSSDRSHLVCADLNDEWADYIGVGTEDVTFYHCKDGSPTTGASDFQIVVGQAQKNLSRIKFSPAEIAARLTEYSRQPMWRSTAGISRLVKSRNGWPDVIAAFTAQIANPSTVWRVALVVTALSKQAFDQEMQRPSPAPHFIQLVWLLSGFASNCKQREAQPVIFCRP